MARRGADPQQRLIEEQMAALAGKYGPAFLTGNGLTGLSKHDAQGYSQMLNDQTTYRNLERQLAGQGPLDVEYGGTITPKIVGSPFDVATGESNADAFGLDADIGGAALAGLRNASPKSAEGQAYTQSQRLRKFRGY